MFVFVDESHLTTNKEVLKLDHFFFDISQVQLKFSSSFCLLVASDWVAWDKQDILWLLHDFRASCVATHDTRLVMRHAFDKINFMKIDVSHLSYEEWDEE